MDTMNLKKLDDKHWQIRFAYTDPLTGRQRICKRRVRGTIDEARAERDRLKVEARAGAMSKKRTGQTLTHYQGYYARARKTHQTWAVSRATRERDYYALKHHIIPLMGGWLVREVGLSDLEGVVDCWLSDDYGDYSTRTVNVWIKVLRLYMRYCCKMEGVSTPAEDLSYRTTRPKTSGTVLTPEQTRRFLAHTRAKFPQWWAFCSLGFITGLRFSTISALRWSDVDYGAGRIRFERSQYHGVVKEGDKTGKIIVLPIIDRIADVLTWHWRHLMERQHPGLSTGLVFPSTAPDGKLNGYLAASGLRNAMASVCDELTDDIRQETDDPAATFPTITPHDMRRTFITRAQELRLDLHAQMAIVGHTERSTTREYDHVSLDRKAQVMGAVSDGI